MELVSRIIFLCFLFSFTLVDAKRPPNPKLYTGYHCNATTECPEGAGFCNEEQQCECSIRKRPQKIGEETVCEFFDCATDYQCKDLYGDNAGCIPIDEYRFCSCIGKLYWSQTDRECSIDRQKIGGDCTNDDNCTIWAIGPGNLYGGRYDGTYCDKATGKCTCQIGQKPHGDWFCKTITCIYPDEKDCEESNPRLEYVQSYDRKNGICQCKKPYEPDQYVFPKSCVIPVSGGPCDAWGLCPPSLKCIKGKCQKNSSNFLSSSFSIFVVFALFAYLL